MAHNFTRRSFLSAATGASATAFGIGATSARQAPVFTLAMTEDGWVGQSPSAISGKNSPTLTVDPGQKVTVKWTNKTDLIHNFVVNRQYPGGKALLRSDYVSPGNSQTVTFKAREGLAAYYCEQHTGEKGDIVVGEGQPTATKTATVRRNLTEPASEAVKTFVFSGSTTGWHALAPDSITGQTNPTIKLVPGNLYAVEWINADGAPHNWEMENKEDETLVRSDTKSQAGARQTVKFEATEDMSVYYCQYHPLSMRGEVQIVSEEEVAQQTTPANQTTAAEETTPPAQTNFTHQTVSRDLSPENATTANQTTTVGNQTTTASVNVTNPSNQSADVGGVDAGGLFQRVRSPEFGALATLGGLGGAMSYLLSKEDDDEE